MKTSDMRFSPKAIILSAALLLAACKGDKKGSDPLAQDPTLKQDLELASTRDSTVQPQLKDVPTNTPPVAAAPSVRRPVERPRPTPAPQPRPAPVVAAAPTPAPPPPTPTTTPSGNTVERRPSAAAEGRVGTVAAGTSIAINSGQRVCTNTNSVGDRFTATLAEPVVASNGVTIPAGTNVVLEVTSLKRSEGSGDNMTLGIVVRSLSYGGKLYPVNGEITSTQTEKVRGKDNNDAAKVAGGAVVGAVLGRILGGKNKTRGTIIGAGTGAAAGAVLATRSAKYDACIPSGGRITVRLNSAMDVQAVSGAGSTTPSSEPAPSSDPNHI